METNDANQGGYSSDKYSTQSREYFDNEQRKNAEFWKRQEENRAKSEQMKAEHTKKMQEIRGRQEAARAKVAGNKFQELPKSSSSQRLGGGKNVGMQREARASLSQQSSERSRLGQGKSIGVQRGKETAPEQDVKEAGLPKLGGTFWWLILGLMIMSDIGSVLCNLLVAAGLGIAGAGSALTLMLGAVVALPLGFSIAALGWAGGIFLAFNAFMFSTGYYWLNHVPLMEARKLATWGTSAIIKMVPLLSAFPTLTISFVVITVMENAKRGSGLLGVVAQKALAKTGPVGSVAAQAI